MRRQCLLPNLKAGGTTLAPSWQARSNNANGWNRSRVRPNFRGNGSQVAGGIGRGMIFDEGFDSRVPSTVRGDGSRVAGAFRGNGSQVVEISGGIGRGSRRKPLKGPEAVDKSASSRPHFGVQQGEWVAGEFCYVVDTTAKNCKFLHPYPFILVFIL